MVRVLTDQGDKSVSGLKPSNNSLFSIKRGDSFCDSLLHGSPRNAQSISQQTLLIGLVILITISFLMSCNATQAQIPTEGLVGYWNFDEGSANLTEGTADDGQPTNTVTFGPGKNGMAAIFHGETNPGHIYIPNSPALQFIDGATYSVWVRVDSPTTAGIWGAVIAKSHDQAGAAFMFLLSPDGEANAHVSTFAGWAQLGAPLWTPHKEVGDWVHVVYSLSITAGIKIYIDGQLFSTSTIPVNFSAMNDQAIYLGKYSDSWWPLYGAIDELRIYNRALSATEIQEITNSNSGHAFSIWPDTGQSKCYDNTQEISCPIEGEPFYGQDAQYTGPPISYTMISDDSIALDNVTGLFWELKENSDGLMDYANPHDADNTYTWCDTNIATNGGHEGTCGENDTMDIIASLNNSNFGGYNDWRLPTIKELATLVNRDSVSPAISQPFSLGQAESLYWSSTTTIYDNNSVWRISFDDGYVPADGKFGPGYTMAVRSDQSQIENQFIDNEDGTVTDNLTGLQWQKATLDIDNDGSPDELNWQDSLEAVENLNLAGKNDWRLPNINELRSLVDYSQYNPSIAPMFAETTVSSNYWSSSTGVRSPNGVWIVGFDFGGNGSGSGDKLGNEYVRAVRDNAEECVNTGILPPSISQEGSDFLVSVTLTEDLPVGYYVAINFDDQQGGWLNQTDAGGHVITTGSGTQYSVLRSLDYPGIRYFRAGIFNAADELQGCYSEANTCTIDSCKEAVIRPNKIGNPSLNGSGSVLIRGVDVATGNYHVSSTDLSVAGKGPDFTLVRSYNSLGGNTSSGEWTFNLDMRASFDQYNILIIAPREDGHSQSFYKDIDGSWYPLNPGNFDTLVEEADDSFTLYTKGNLLYRFAAPEGSSAGRLQSIEDRDDNTLVFSHTDNRITGATDASGRSYTITRDGNGRITEVSDFTFRSVNYTWNASDMLLAATNPRNKTTDYTYLATHLLTVTGPRNNLLQTIAYYTAGDDAGLVQAVTDGLGNAWGFQYGIDNVYSDNLPSTAVIRPSTNGINNNIIFHVDDDRTRVLDRLDSLDVGNYKTSSSFLSAASSKRLAETSLVERRVRPSGSNTDYEYSNDGKGNRTKTIDVLNRETITAYGDIAGQTNLTPLTSVQTPGVQEPTEYRSFTESGKAQEIEDSLNNKIYRTYTDGLLKDTTDARGNSSSIVYDAKGRPIEFIDALGNVNTTTYDELGHVTSKTNGRGFITTYSYDANGNVLTTTDADGNTTTNTYNDSDNLATTTDPLGNTTTYTYDSLNRKIEEKYSVSGQELKRTFTYDALGRVNMVTNEKVNTSEKRFDPRGNTLQSIDPLSATIVYTYDANGNLETVTDAEGRTLTYTYDDLDREISTTDPLGNTKYFTYNTQGLLSSSTDARGKMTEFAYDALGHLTDVTDADGGVTEASYDANGNLASTTDRNGHTTNYTYDALNRLEVLTDANGRQWSFTYDANANMLSKTTPSGEVTNYTYDNLDQLRAVEYPESSTVSYTYDANGNRKTMTDSVGTTSYDYDELNRLTTVTNCYGQTVSYGYDETGQLQSLTYPDGEQVTYNYDATDRLKSLTDWLGDTTTYTRDSSGLIKTIEYGNGAIVETNYDDVGRLISMINKSSAGAIISSHDLTLDGVGNIIESSMDIPLLPTDIGRTAVMIYDDANRLSTVSATLFSHDDDGRMTSAPNKVDPIQYTFNAYDLITSVTHSGIITDTYTYDGDGRRIARTTGGLTKRYVIDPTGGDMHKMLAETNDSDTIQQYYIYGDGLVSQINGADHHYYHFDPSGNTLTLSGEAGTITDSYAYEPFGNTTVNGTTHNPFRFVGRFGVMDDVNGLHYMRARYYRSDLRRFVSLDALYGEVGNPLSLNRYQYVGGNPIAKTDSTGLSGVLTIHSKGSSISGMTAEDGGPAHSWISYKKDSDGQRTTWGTRFSLGLTQDRELDEISEASRSKHIDDDQEKKLYRQIRWVKAGDIAKSKIPSTDKTSWDLLAPCSTFASNTWLYVTGEFLSPFGPNSNPRTLKNSILRKNMNQSFLSKDYWKGYTSYINRCGVFGGKCN